MDLSSLIRKPKIEYTPEHVELPQPEAAPETIVMIANPEDITDVLDMAKEEIQALDDLKDALISALPSFDVEVPEEMQDLVGKSRITMSDYLESLSSDEYGPVGIRDIYEDYASGPDGEPGILTIPLVDTMRQSLARSCELVADQMFAGEFPPSGATDAALWSIKCDIDDCQRFREEVSRAATAARKVIDRLIWANVLDVTSVDEIRSRGQEITDSLKRIKALIKISSTLYAADWKSAMTTLRDHFYAALIDTQMNALLSIYKKAYDKTVGPAFKILNVMQGNRVLQDRKDIRDITALFERSLTHITGQVENVISDIYAIRRKRSEFALNGAKACGAMAYTRRLTSQLDTIIAAVETMTGVGGTFPLGADAVYGDLGKILDDKRVYQLAPTDVGFSITDEDIDAIRARLPQVPDPLKESHEVTF